MDLAKLFDMQRELDERILDRFPELRNEDLLDKKILALQVELGELANELPQEFKYWSNKKNNYEKALKEYVDCLHFILSIGNYFGIKCEPSLTIVPNNVLEQLNVLFKIVSFLHNKYEDYGYCCGIRDFYEDLVGNFMNLGKLLGFTWEQIEQAYLEKNAVNHQRQEEGY